MQSPRATPGPEDDTAAGADPRQAGLLATLLYAGWALVAAMASGLGLFTLELRAGLLLGSGILATLLLLRLLASQAGQWPGEQAGTVATSHAVMGIIWATLYAHFADGAPAVLAGMVLSAVALPALYLSPAGLFRIALLAFACYAGMAALQMTLPEPRSSAWLIGLVALTMMLCVLLLFASELKAQRKRTREALGRLEFALKEARHNSERDELTHSYSRRYMMDMLRREKSRSDRSGEGFSICLLDIDHFKAVNDRFGHLTGDRILTSFVRRLRRELRGMDSINAGGMPRALGRFGGEEFLVVLPGTGLQGALRCAERLRQAIVRRPFGGLHHVTTSIGIAEHQQGESLEQLLRRCDEALYAAKRAGRNRVNCSTAPGRPDTIVMPDLRNTI
ncbi:MAG: GGDEF domain-containing protein [Chromatiales bacterium]|nr:GGDEF domain-containing protein [Chromatiales bacterium]